MKSLLERKEISGTGRWEISVSPCLPTASHYRRLGLEPLVLEQPRSARPSMIQTSIAVLCTMPSPTPLELEVKVSDYNGEGVFKCIGCFHHTDSKHRTR